MPTDYKYRISIQALYDYKARGTVSVDRLWQISIQALYDYKQKQAALLDQEIAFQFKHCTIIRVLLQLVQAVQSYFNSSIVRL